MRPKIARSPGATGARNFAQFCNSAAKSETGTPAAPAVGAGDACASGCASGFAGGGVSSGCSALGFAGDGDGALGASGFFWVSALGRFAVGTPFRQSVQLRVLPSRRGQPFPPRVCVSVRELMGHILPLAQKRGHRIVQAFRAGGRDEARIARLDIVPHERCEDVVDRQSVLLSRFLLRVQTYVMIDSQTDCLAS